MARLKKSGLRRMAAAPETELPAIRRPETPQAGERFAADLKSIERLPAQTKELLLLKDQAEKSTGRENVTLNRKIRKKSGS